jgi:parallel beta-helix repeat protein
MELRLLSLLLVVIVVWSLQAEAAERIVDANGDDLGGANDCLADPPCRTITQAIKRAQPGDIIRVKGGTYDEKAGESFPIIVDKPLKIEASPKATIDGGGGALCIWITASDTELMNFTIKGCDTGILIEEASDVIVQGNTLKPVKTGVLLRGSTRITVGGEEADEKNEIEEAEAEGIKLESSHDNEIINNEIAEARSCIVLKESRKNRVSKNTIRDCAEEGIKLSDSDENYISDNTIQREGPGGYGLLMKARGSKNMLVSNTLSGYTYGILQSGSFKLTALQGNITTDNEIGIGLQGVFQDIMIERNIASNNAEDGILFELKEGANNRLIGNVLSGNKQYGILFKGPEGRGRGLTLTISGNTINGNGEAGIYLENSLGNTISANIIHGNAEAGIILKEGLYNTLIENDIRFHDRELSSIGISLEGGEGNDLLINSVRDNGIGISLKGSADNTIAGNTVSNNKCNGIELRDSSKNRLQQNIVSQNAKDRRCPDGPGAIVLSGRSLGNTIFKSTIQGNENGISIRDFSKENTFECNDIKDNSNNGILLIEDVAGNIFHRNNIEGNGIGLRNFTASVVDVRFNWWGSPSGPQHPDNRPAVEEGKADEILGPANFAPWLESPIDIKSCSSL